MVAFFVARIRFFAPSNGRVPVSSVRSMGRLVAKINKRFSLGTANITVSTSTSTELPALCLLFLYSNQMVIK